MKTIIILLIKLYKIALSPILEVILGKGCRFNPTCSTYSIKVIDKFGLRKGIILSAKRLSRCHPFSKVEFDPIPN